MTFLPNEHCAEACKNLVLTLLLLSHGVKAYADSTLPYTLSTRIESEWAVYVDADIDKNKKADTQKLQFTTEPELDVTITENVRLTSIVRLRMDAKNEISPGDNNQGELREFYLDAAIRNSSIILGKQQVVWGKADGLKVLDIVNPQDFREFILDDFEQSRIPLWTINAEIPINNLTLQLLFIPDLSYHEFANTGAAYEFTSPHIIPQLSPTTNVTFSPLKKPVNLFNDADIGFRLSSFYQGWDLTLNYLYHYDDTPVLFRTLKQGNSNITIEPEYKRSHLIGGTFSNTFGDLTLRGELGYLSDKYISTSNPDDVDGVIKTGELKYVLGFDWYGFNDSLLSLQLFQTYLTHHQTGMIRDRLNTQITVLVKQDYMNETLRAEILLLQDIDYKDGMIRPKLMYDYNDTITLFAGLDIFYGNKDGLFGQFKETDRFTSGLVIGF